MGILWIPKEVKAVLDCEGVPCFRELAMIPVLKQQGFVARFWVDNYRRCFLDAMPPATLPAQVRKLYERMARDDSQ